MYTKRFLGRWPAKDVGGGKKERRGRGGDQTETRQSLRAFVIFGKQMPKRRRLSLGGGLAEKTLRQSDWRFRKEGGGGEINGVSSDFGEGCESHLEVLHHSAIKKKKNPDAGGTRRMLNGLFMAVTPRCVWDNRLRRRLRRRPLQIEKARSAGGRATSAAGSRGPAVTSRNKTKVPLNGLSRGDVKVRRRGGRLY